VKFIDEVVITVQSGNGGRGCVSFRREKYVPLGGPDGGDGGKGGDVVFRATTRKRTLYQFQFRKHFIAKNGANGQGKQKTGRNGQDLNIEVPPGTVVRDAQSDKILKDFIHAGEIAILAQGGKGGRGNYRFKTSTNRTPRFAQLGESGQILTLKLELKLLADVGIIGLPNAGKSTLISVLSSARPKIGDYPFTTLSPTLGVVQIQEAEPFVVADIPGLIAGAHQGTGLGIKFLRHVERTQILLHLIDASTIDPASPLLNLATVDRELAMYRKTLATKPQVIVLNKMDLPGTEQKAKIFQSAAKQKNVLLISAKTGLGLKKLRSSILNALDRSYEQ
jgi:GTP-binding protein